MCDEFKRSSLDSNSGHLVKEGWVLILVLVDCFKAGKRIAVCLCEAVKFLWALCVGKKECLSQVAASGVSTWAGWSVSGDCLILTPDTQSQAEISLNIWMSQAWEDLGGSFTPVLLRFPLCFTSCSSAGTVKSTRGTLSLSRLEPPVAQEQFCIENA